jgi:hypothetical protein
MGGKLTFCLLLLLLPTCPDFPEDVDPLDCCIEFGDIERAGTFGGCPGSAPGDLLRIDL